MPWRVTRTTASSRLAQQHSDGCLIARSRELLVDGIDVEVELADVLWLKAADLQLDYDPAPCGVVVEEQVEEEVAIPDTDQALAAGVEEPLAEADHELLDLADQRSLDVTLAAAWRDLDEVEHQRIARDLLDGLRFDHQEDCGALRPVTRGGGARNSTAQHSAAPFPSRPRPPASMLGSPVRAPRQDSHLPISTSVPSTPAHQPRPAAARSAGRELRRQR